MGAYRLKQSIQLSRHCLLQIVWVQLAGRERQLRILVAPEQQLTTMLLRPQHYQFERLPRGLMPAEDEVAQIVQHRVRCHVAWRAVGQAELF